MREPRGDHPLDVFGLMLAIAVERHDRVGAAPEAFGKARPQRRRLAAIAVVAQYRQRQAVERSGRSISRSVVDDDDDLALR
jgi:hypothetical protein